jgi:hypothetical protein
MKGIKIPGDTPDVEIWIRLDTVVKVSTRLAPEYTAVTLQLENGERINFNPTRERYQELIASLEA